LLKNAFADEGFNYWTLTQNGGSGVHVENWGGLEGHQNCFVTSYAMGALQQKFKLSECGWTQQMINLYKPQILVSGHYSGRGDCASECRFKLAAVSNSKVIWDTNMMDTSATCKQVTQEIDTSYCEYDEFVFEQSGKDKCFWAGWYGARLCGASVRLMLSDASVAMLVAHQTQQ